MQIKVMESLGVHHTISLMRDLVDQYKVHPRMRNLVAWMCRDLDDDDVLGLANRVYDYVRRNVTYRSDIAGVETLQSALVTLDLGIGDCDDMSILAATILEAAGRECKFVTLGYDGDDATHVVCAVQGGDDVRTIIIDAVASPCDTVSVLSGLTLMELH